MKTLSSPYTQYLTLQAKRRKLEYFIIAVCILSGMAAIITRSELLFAVLMSVDLLAIAIVLLLVRGKTLCPGCKLRLDHIFAINEQRRAKDASSPWVAYCPACGLQFANMEDNGRPDQ